MHHTWAPQARGRVCACGASGRWRAGPSTQPLGVVTKRLVAAFLLAPLVPAVLYSSISWMLISLSGGISEFFVTAFVVYLAAAWGTLLLALPVFLALKRFNLARWWSALGVGAALGLLYTLLIGANSPSAPLLRGYCSFPVIGAMSGLVFWLVHRPVTPPNNRSRGPE